MSELGGRSRKEKRREGMYTRAFGENVEVTLRVMKETSEEANRAKARKTEAVPSIREVEEHRLDHSVFKSWCPQCVRGRAKACGHRRGKGDEGEAPVIGVDYMNTHCDQEKEEGKGMPIVVLNDEKTKMIAAKVVPSKGVDACVVDSVRRALEQLGHRRIILRSDSE